MAHLPNHHAQNNQAQNSQANNSNAGFTLPAPTDSPAASAPSSSVSTVSSAPMVNAGVVEVPAGGSTDSSSRDLLIGGAVLLVILVILFFIKNAYATRLVSQRVQPNKANAAGWWLYIFLGAVSTGVMLFLVSPPKYLTALTFGAISFVAIVSFILLVVSARK